MWRRSVLALALAACGNGDGPIVADLTLPPPIDLAAGCPQHSQFFSGWSPPVGAFTRQCSPMEIDQFVLLVTHSGLQGLQQFFSLSAGTPCGACLGSPAPLTQSGTSPFVARTNGVLDPNVGGCVALLQDRFDAQSCGAAVQGRDDCLALQCASCGPVVINADLIVYDKCLAQAAQQVECASYVASAGCLDQDPVAANCRSSAWASTADWVRFLAELFCGAPGDM